MGMVGHMWPAGRGLAGPVLDQLQGITNASDAKMQRPQTRHAVNRVHRIQNVNADSETD